MTPVQVWSASLEHTNAVVEQLRDSLDATDRARADRFATPHLRRRFILAHAFLRDVLHRHCAVPPNLLVFGTGAHGKPFLHYPQLPDLHFNLSHSGEMALCVIAPQEIGVDIEKPRHLRYRESLVKSCFGERERQLLAQSPDTDRAFYAAWTRKEAVIKAAGAGLSIPLLSFEVLPSPCGHLTAEAAGHLYHVYDLELPTGYLGAVAAQCELTITNSDWLASP